MSDFALPRQPLYVESRTRARRPPAVLDEDDFLGLFSIFHRDGVFTLVLFGAMLFDGQLGSYAALVFCLCTAGYAALRWKDFPAILGSRWFLLLFPALALCSSIWSDMPSATMKYATEYALTVIAALLIASAENPRAAITGIFAAFAVYIVAALAVGNVVDVGTTGATAVAGLTDSKNQEADIAATGFFVSAALFLMGLRWRSWPQCVMALAVAAIQLYAMYAARSAGAVAGLGAGLGMLLLTVLLRSSGPITRGSALTVIGFGAAALAVLFIGFTADVLDWLAAGFGKDPTLTGRTYLWSRAADLVAESPYLGHGFAAFWQHGNLDAEGLWQYGGITNRSGFNFHSTFYETLVGLGWVGLVALLTMFVSGLVSLVCAYSKKPTLLACFWLGMAAYMFVRMPTESTGLNEFYFATVLLYSLLAYGGGPVGNIPRQATAAFARVNELRRQADEFEPSRAW